MTEVKVRLSMVVPGATMLSTQDCVKMSKKDAYNQFSMVIEYPERKGKKTVKKKETLHVNTRKSRPARQNLSITKEAFSYMTDGREIPSPKVAKIWANMSKSQRLEYHLNLIAENFNATSYSYEVLDD